MTRENMPRYLPRRCDAVLRPAPVSPHDSKRHGVIRLGQISKGD